MVPEPHFTYDLNCSDFTVNPGDYATLDETIPGFLSSAGCSRQDGDSPEYAKLSLEGFAGITLRLHRTQLVKYVAPSIPADQVSGAVGAAMASYPTVQDIVQTGLSYSSVATNVPLIPRTGSPSGDYDGIEIIALGGYKTIALMWGKQTNPTLSNLLYYEVQVSPDGTNWYSLVFDGSAYGSVFPATTEVAVEYLLHTLPDNLDGSGNPQTWTLQYRVRRKVTDGSFTGWSDPVTGTSKVVRAGDIAANTITGNKLTVGALQTAFAQVSGELIIGATYVIGGSPSEGDQKLSLTNNTLALMEYDSGAWNTILQVGGSGLLNQYLQARGLIKTGADISAIPIGNRARAPRGKTTSSRTRPPIRAEAPTPGRRGGLQLHRDKEEIR